MNDIIKSITQNPIVQICWVVDDIEKTAQNYDKIVSSMTDNGIGVEMSGVLGGATRFTYFATQKDLATIFEITHTNPEAHLTLEPFGQIGLS